MSFENISFRQLKETDQKIGDLSNLSTTDKTSVVAAMNELFTSASNGKSAIATAITGKGIPTSATDTFAQMATNIGNILTGASPTGTINITTNGIHNITNYASANVNIHTGAVIPTNQLVPNPQTLGLDWVGLKRCSGQIVDDALELTCNASVSSTNLISVRICLPINIIANHKYLLIYSYYYDSNNTDLSSFTTITSFIARNDGAATDYVALSTYNMVPGWITCKGIISCSVDVSSSSQDTANGIWIGLKGNANAAVGDKYKIKNVNVIDLTAMYGVGNEPSTQSLNYLFGYDIHPYTPLI